MEDSTRPSRSESERPAPRTSFGKNGVSIRNKLVLSKANFLRGKRIVPHRIKLTLRTEPFSVR